MPLTLKCIVCGRIFKNDLAVQQHFFAKHPKTVREKYVMEGLRYAYEIYVPVKDEEVQP